MTPPQFRIGELARRVGTTPRAVRYYEELGLLPGSDRSDGAHRVYDEQDEARLRDLLHGDLPLLYVGRTRRAYQIGPRRSPTRVQHSSTKLSRVTRRM